MQERQQQDSRSLSHADGVNLAYFAANVHATCLSPFFRKGFGLEHPGIYGFWAGVLIMFVAAFDPTGATFVYFWVWLFALIYRRVETFKLVKNTVIHSRYPGYPWMAMKVPFIRKLATATGIIEPELCLVAGAMLMVVSETLGELVMVGFLSFFVRNAIEADIIRKRLQLMQDARIEQEYYSRRFRNPFEE